MPDDISDAGSDAIDDSGDAGIGGDVEKGAKTAERTFTQADVDRIISGRLAKFADYDEVKTQLAAIQDASATEQERAVKAARKEGHQAAATDFGALLAHSQFEAAAARRNKDFDTGPALELIDLKRFVGKDGVVDTASIQAAVDRLVPEASVAPPSFDGGARGSGSGKAMNMNDFIRRQATGRRQ